jgi:predicted nucleic acid-binding protein
MSTRMSSSPSSSGCGRANKNLPAELIVLDANILIRAVLGRRVEALLERYASETIRFCAPQAAFADAEKYLPPLLRKIGKSDSNLTSKLVYLRRLVEPVETEVYRALEDSARERLRNRDEEDWPVLVAALALNCPIWTEDADFFGTGVAVWTTSRIEIFLRNAGRSSL